MQRNNKKEIEIKGEKFLIPTELCFLCIKDTPFCHVYSHDYLHLDRAKCRLYNIDWAYLPSELSPEWEAYVRSNFEPKPKEDIMTYIINNPPFIRGNNPFLSI